MGICAHCGQSAGWFRSSHQSCQETAARGIEELKQAMVDAVLNGQKFAELEPTLTALKKQYRILDAQAVNAAKAAWNRGASERAIKEPVSFDDFDILSDLYKAAGFEGNIWTTPGGRDIVFSHLIWTALHDHIDPYQGPIRFNLQEGETPVFGIANTLVSEQRASSTYVGAYQGVSIKVANGLYYRLGGLRGHKVESTSLKELDYGDFLITTHGVYFGGTAHGTNFRIPFKQVIRFQPYADGIGICKDGAKERIFVPQKVENSGWFLFNLLQALAGKSSAAAHS